MRADGHVLEKIADGRTDLVFDYLQQGHAATSADAGGTRLIAWCAYHGDVSALRLLLREGESLASLGDDLGLLAAAFHGHWQLCQFLVDSGADVNFRDAATGERPLHASLCKANRPVYEHVVAILLAAGAEPNARTRKGAETGSFMRDCRTKAETPLHRAAAFGTAATIRRLLEAGADREARDEAGDSPLSWASWHLRPPEILRLLCFGEFSIHPDNPSDYDHGTGWSTIDPANLGKPRS